MNRFDEIRNHVLAAYGDAIGQPFECLLTPALLLDIDAVTANIEGMASAIATTATTLRPHYKAHKSPELARLQLTAGARGMSVATVWEAATLVDSGVTDIFIVNTIVDPARIDLIARLAQLATIAVAVDNAENIAALSRAAVCHDTTIDTLVEIDTGMHRAGVDRPDAAVRLAEQVAASPGLRFRGATGYEGHCSLEDDVSQRMVLQRTAMGILLEAVEALVQRGLPCPVVSAGGTRTWWMTASTPCITEIQAGSYVLMDQFHTGIEGGFRSAISVATTVISVADDRVIVDAGSKAIADSDLAVLKGLAARNLGFDEEHGRFSREPGIALGDVLQILPGYAPSTVNAFDCYHVVHDGIVTDVWPIVPRSPGHHGLLHREPFP